MVPFKKNLQLIQVLRGIASLLVVLFHITGNFSETYHQHWLGNIFLFGNSGVDIFFVLSGFIITYSNRQYITMPTSIIKFLKKRAIRVFPIYWVVITFFIFLQIIFPTYYRTHYYLDIVNILNTYFLLLNHNMVNGVSWTLTYELFFYLLFVIALSVPHKKYTLLLLFAYFIFLLIVPIIIPTISENQNSIIQLLVFPMNIEFLLGIFVVLFLDSFAQKFCIPILIIGICLFIVSTIISYMNLHIFNSLYNRVLLFGLPSFFIILSLVKYELAFSIKSHNLLLKLGDASYSIYLFHLPLVAAFFKIIAKLHINNPIGLTVLSFGLFIIICYLGIIIYKWIEEPLIKWLNSKLI